MLYVGGGLGGGNSPCCNESRGVQRAGLLITNGILLLPDIKATLSRIVCKIELYVSIMYHRKDCHDPDFPIETTSLFNSGI